MKLYEITAFTRDNLGGNKAGIILEEDYDVVASNQARYCELAKTYQYSEIVVGVRVTKENYVVRYFTPEQEIDFCGHASVALGYLLMIQEAIDINEITLDTEIGDVNVINKDNAIYYEVKKHHIGDYLNKEDIATSLNISSKEIVNQPQIVDSSIPDVMIHVDSLHTLNSIVMDSNLVKKISTDNEVVGYHVLAIDNQSFYTRNFAPLYGIDEESATGSSSASMYLYLVENQIITKGTTITFLQGDAMNAPSAINVTTINNDLYVGGQCQFNQTYII